jgi:hypothetical protein
MNGSLSIRLKQLLPAVLPLACALLLASYTFSHRQTILWDFVKDCAGAFLFRQGLNPFDDALLYSTSGLPDLPYVYPLATTFLFMPFTYLDYSQAIVIWLTITIILLCGLIVIWQRFCTETMSGFLFPACAFLICNLAIPKNALNGNICTLETVLIWLGLVALVRGRTRLFSVLLGFAASFKLSPIILVGAMLIHKRTRQWKDASLAILILAGVLAVSFLLEPSWFTAYTDKIFYVVNSSSRDDFMSPTLLALTRRLSGGAGPTDLRHFIPALSLYVTATVLLGWLAAASLRRLSAVAWPEAGIPTIMYFCLTYALLVPRFADYNYLLIIPAVWYAFHATLQGKWTTLWIALLLVPLPFVTRPVIGSSGDGDFYFGLWSYWNLLVLVAAWGLLTYAILQGRVPERGNTGRANHG